MRIFLLIATLFIHHSFYAQVPEWNTHSFEQNIDISFLSKDSLGFIWTCSKTELLRYNGQEVDSKFKLTEDEFTAFQKNDKGLFCLGTKKGRCLLFDPKTCQSSELFENSSFKNITSLYIIDNENYALSSYGVGLLLSIKGKQFELNNDSGLLSNELYDLVYLDGKYYIGTDQGIQIIDVMDKEPKFDYITLEDGLPDLVVTQLAKSGNELWFSDYDKHVGLLDHDFKIKLLPALAPSKIHELKISDARVFVSNDHGIFQLVSGAWVKKYPIDGKKKIERFIIDQENNLWLKSTKNAISKGSLTLEKQLSLFGNVRTFFTDGDSKFLIGKDSGLYQYTKDRSEKINEKNITCIRRHQEYLLVGTFSDGLLLYDKDLNLLDQKDSWMDITNQSVLHIFSFKDEIYVSSLSGVMKFKLNGPRLEELESINDKIGRDYIYSIHWTGEKFIFGTDRNGLIVWDPSTDQSEKVKTFKNQEKIGSVYSITEDKKGTVWFSSTSKGVGQITENGVDFIQNLENISDEYTTVSSLSDDKIILVRSSSIEILNPKTLESKSFNGKLDSRSQSEFLNAIVHLEDKSFILHDNSVMSYTPSSISRANPSVIIDQVKVNLSPVEKRRSFKEDECNIEFSFKGLWLSDPSSLTFRYKLDGFDEDWRETRNNTVAFSKLRPGKYVFNLQCSKNKVFANAATLEYPFQISAHWYNRTITRILGVAAALFFVWSYFRNREKQKNEKLALENLKIENQLTNLKNQLNPHFLFNSFNTLIGLIEEDTPKSIEFVERLSDFYRAMLELGKLDLVPLEKEIELLEQYMSILMTRFSGQLHFKTEYDNLDDFVLPPFSLQMLVENAVKHNVISSKAPLDIRVTKTDDIVSVWNQKNLLLSTSKGTKTGLENISRRFKLAGLEEPIILDQDDFFEVKLKLKNL